MRFRLKNGFDIPLDGAADTVVALIAETRRVALVGSDYAGMRASMTVTEGTGVRAGDTLFTDRRHPEIRVTAPVSGVVRQITRGRRRRLESVVMDMNDDRPRRFERFKDASLASLPSKVVREQLLEAGQWVAFRGRPFERVPPPQVEPRAIFITAIDTNPLAPNPALAVSEHVQDFGRGVTVISRLTQGRTYVCTTGGLGTSLPDLPNVLEAEFDGPHPAGLPGTHIHALGYRIGDTPDLWHIGYQDVIAIGQLFRLGYASPQRLVAICGPGARSPRVLRVNIGADLSELMRHETKTACRLISGSVLSGHQMPGFLGRYHNQVTVLPHAQKSVIRIRQLGRMLLRGNVGLDPAACSAVHGWPSGMLPLEEFERVWPYRVPPAALLRALLVGDTDSAMSLGCQGLAEEDLALCTYVCAAKYDYGAALRSTLRNIEQRK